MKVFTRSVSGIANYPKFHRKDFMVYIEGKAGADGDIDPTDTASDIVYFETVLNYASGGKKPKIKCVGNKHTALEYARKLREGELNNGLVIVDKDLEGVLSSVLNIFPVLRTYGYSWENELWQKNTLSHVLDLMTNSSPKSQDFLSQCLINLTYRTKFISALDAAAQVNGTFILDKKKGLCGVKIDNSKIARSELVRFLKKFRDLNLSNCSLSTEIVRSTLTNESMKVVQGHFWENLSFNLLGNAYVKYTKGSRPPNNLLRNLAFSYLKAYPKNALGHAVASYYSHELKRLNIC